MRRKLYLCLLFATCLLAGCGSDTPQDQLGGAVRQLKRNLDAHDTQAVLEQLHRDFRAQGGYDRDWAHRTLGQVFAEQQGMRFIALGKTTRVDRLYDGIGRTQVELAVTGDAGLLPERRRNRPYSVSLEWWREGNTWKLARLDWR